MSGVHLSSMWEQVSKTTHIACKEQSSVGPSSPKRTNCLRAWNKSSPTKRHFWGQCPPKALSTLGGSFWDLLWPHGFVTPKGMPLPLLRLMDPKECIMHAMRSSFWDLLYDRTHYGTHFLRPSVYKVRV